MKLNKICLGTAQFGLNYGIANKIGKIKKEETRKILDYAAGVGIKSIDTAMDYGSSEEIIGQYSNNRFQVGSKLPALEPNILDIESSVETQVRNSIKRLNVKTLDYLLLHRPYDLETHQKRLVNGLKRVKEQGLVKKIGITVYNEETIEMTLKYMQIDIIQIPANIADHRLIKSKYLKMLKADGCDIYARSAFLQGLLLIERHNLPKSMLKWKNEIDRWHRYLDYTGQTALDTCLMYLSSIKEIDRIVIGIDNQCHLKEIVNSCTNITRESINIDFKGFKDADLVNPSKWTTI